MYAVDLDTPVYSGPGIDIAPPQSDPPSDIDLVTRYLLCKDLPVEHSFSSEFFQAVFFKPNLRLIQEARRTIASILEQCCNQLPPQDTTHPVLFEAFVGHLISFLAFTYPGQGAQFTLPIKQADGQWRAHSYRVDECITIPTLAYGLSSLDGGPPLLLFMGTAFPAGARFTETLLNDFIPFSSVGHLSYQSGKGKLHAWLQDKTDVRLYGISLGGTLAFHTLRDYSPQIGQVYVYNPPGLYPWDWDQRQFNTGAQVHIYCQKNDLVLQVGQFPSGKSVQVYHISREKEENPAAAHARIYTGGNHVTIERGDAHLENQRSLRKLMSAVHMVASVIFFIPLMCLHLLRKIF